jgi:hypothetical protein
MALQRRRIAQRFQYIGGEQPSQFIVALLIRAQIGTRTCRRVWIVAVELEHQHRQVLGTAKHRVAAFAVQDHRQTITRRSARQKQVGRGKRVADRTVEQGDGFRQMVGNGLSIEGEHSVRCTAVRRNQTGVRQFVGVLVAKIDRIRAYWSVVQPCCQRSDQAAVDAAGEEDPHVLVDWQACSNRLFEQIAQPLCIYFWRVSFTPFIFAWLPEDFLTVRTVGAQAETTPWKHLVHAIDQRFVTRQIGKRQERTDGIQVQARMLTDQGAQCAQ